MIYIKNDKTRKVDGDDLPGDIIKDLSGAVIVSSKGVDVGNFIVVVYILADLLHKQLN